MPLLEAEGERSDQGLRSLIVGAGSADHKCERTPDQPQPEVYDCSSSGVLELQLRPDGYDWEFVPSTGDFTDEGSSGLR